MDERMEPETSLDLTACLHSSASSIPAAAWNACAGSRNPFISHDFFMALEESGSVAPRNGWLPQHLSLADPAGDIVGIVPLYAKSHSRGEYVFDHGWAEAFQQAGGRYYPKLQSCVPFSPVPGPRLLHRPGLLPGMLGEALIQTCQALELSSVHVSFCQQEEAQALEQLGFLSRIGTQYHWQNNGYHSFDDFLGALSSRKRKQLRRERRDANEAGLVFKTLRGNDIKPWHWDAFYAFYLDTVDRKWGHAYLTREFFTALSERLGDAVILMTASSDHALAGAALNLMDDDALYGRNWGCRDSYPFLHFELCYYRALDFAIANGLGRVEAGAQGEHKIQRGYLPVPTYSAHWIAHPGLSDAVASYLAAEKSAMQAEMEALATLSPFRKAQD
ncbi:putative cytosolic protein [Granulibacter bethesdensis]|uniref:Cytosolic protein n=2 Tax=Granulibacter bethesdensis TaxID=364410 RepID=A0AAN0REU7_9PROT|nr:putative cytosolic protein [Granulibacter bethesdensis]